MTIPLDRLADAITEVASSSSERIIIGIVGAPGAGKSTLTEALTHRLGAVSVPMDGFHLANRQLELLGRRGRKGAPDTFDARGYANLLERLRAHPDEDVFAPDFDRAIDEPIANAIRVGAEHKLVLAEGNYLLLRDNGWEHVQQQLHRTWYLDVSATRRTQRLISRHRAFGRSSSDAIHWVADVDAANAHVVEASRHRADHVLTDFEQAATSEPGETL